MLWSIGSFITLRYLTKNAPSEEQEKKFNATIAPIYYVLPTFTANVGYSWITDVFSLKLQLILVGLSLLIWLVPSPKMTNKKVNKSVSLNSIFFVSKQAKLVFSALSPLGLTSFLCLQFLLISIVALAAFYGEIELLYMAGFFFVLQSLVWLQQKEKLTHLLFLLNGQQRFFEKTVYRAMFNLNLYFTIIAALLMYLISYFIGLDIYPSVLMMMIFLTFTVLYLLVSWPPVINAIVSISLYVGGILLIHQNIDLIVWVNAFLSVFAIWSFIYPPTNWFRDDYGLIQQQSPN